MSELVLSGRAYWHVLHSRDPCLLRGVVVPPGREMLQRDPTDVRSRRAEMLRRHALRPGIALSPADALGAPASSAAAQATKRSLSVNDGLPKQWIGVTKWTFGNFGIKTWLIPTTVAEVTLTLTKKGPRSPFANADGGAGKTGTYYEYRPKGKITVVGWCGKTPITVALKPIDGFLSIFVPNDNKRAAYVGYDFSTLGSRQPSRCPDGLRHDGPVIAYWGLRTEFGSKGKRYQRTTSTSAEVIAGTYLVNDTLGTYQSLDKYKWCFVRDRRNLGKCR